MSLRTIWTELNKRLCVPEECVSNWWIVVETRYSEPQRHYHTLAHIEDLFQKFDTVKELLEKPLSVSVAIFFHDIIYDPIRPDNEEASAKLFEQFSEESSTDQLRDINDTVVDWILCTKKHQTPEHLAVGAHGQTDLHYFLDMDMSVLGRPDQEYTAYVDQIEKEYSHMSEEAFNNGRTMVLKKFLEVPNIFATKEFRDKFERQARHNIEMEIARREAIMKKNSGQGK